MKNMAKDIQDVLPTPETLEGERMEKEDLLNKVMAIKDFVLLPSSFEGSISGEFAVVQADVAGKVVTFSGGSVITKKLQAIGKEAIKEINGLKCRLVKTKSKKGGRQYWDIVSAK
jgi:hypothetical protein